MSCQTIGFIKSFLRFYKQLFALRVLDHVLDFIRIPTMLLQLISNLLQTFEICFRGECGGALHTLELFRFQNLVIKTKAHEKFFNFLLFYGQLRFFFILP